MKDKFRIRITYKRLKKYSFVIYINYRMNNIIKFKSENEPQHKFYLTQVNGPLYNSETNDFYSFT
jgi:hypothetical protein